MSANHAELLKSLRIDRSAPPPPASRRWLWIVLAVIAVIALLGTAGWALFGRDKGIEVRTSDISLDRAAFSPPRCGTGPNAC